MTGEKEPTLSHDDSGTRHSQHGRFTSHLWNSDRVSIDSSAPSFSRERAHVRTREKHEVLCAASNGDIVWDEVGRSAVLSRCECFSLGSRVWELLTSGCRDASTLQSRESLDRFRRSRDERKARPVPQSSWTDSGDSLVARPLELRTSKSRSLCQTLRRADPSNDGQCMIRQQGATRKEAAHFELEVVDDHGFTFSSFLQRRHEA